MSDPKFSPSAAEVPEYRAAQRWNIVWVVPILALLVGAWMIYQKFTANGPVANVRFATAEGIAAKQTEVRCRSVRVGVVRDVKLDEDLKSVVTNLELNPDYESLLREGTRFWVVRARLSGTEVSGLGTLIAGTYIELDPGPKDGKRVDHFDGLETPPATNRDIPGRRLVLTTDQAGSLAAGSPVYYRGFEVGRVENRKLNPEGTLVTYDAFIREEYSGLVKKNTRFWNTSGIDITAGASGFKVRTPSIQAMISGGVTFGVPEGIEAGEVVADGASFRLFGNEDEAEDSTFNPTMKLVLLFDQSVRGLSKAAPVEYRGIPIGRVADISFDYQNAQNDSRIPVLIEIDPAILRRESAMGISQTDLDCLTEAVKRGLRSALKTGSLLTGALYVDLDFYKDVQPAELFKTGDYESIPTVSSGFAQLEAKLTAILDKIGALPLDDTLKKFGTVADEVAHTAADSRRTLVEIEETAASARKLIDSPEFAALPSSIKSALASVEKSVSSVGPDGAIQGDLLRTLDELRAALRAVTAMTTAIDEKPNSLLFGRDTSGNPIPKAPKLGR